jgi:MoaA/NifB/PqqE/SkfB family radical SAM enzyme
VEIDLSNVCPHDCPFCSFGTSKSGGYRQQNWTTFPYPRILALLDELESYGVRSVTFTGGGEPLAHPHVREIFEHTLRLSMDWGLVTNGLLLHRVAAVVAAGASFVRVSLDAGTPETHHFTHGLPDGQDQYSRILKNISNLRELSRDLTIGASFCAMDQNYKEIYKAAKDVKDAGANYLEVRPTFPTDWRGDGWGNALSDPDAAKVEVDHARLHLNDANFSVIGMTSRFDAVNNPRKRYSQCRIGGLTSVIGADGRLWHCCVQRGQPGFEMGNVSKDSFKSVWERGDHTGEGINLAKCPRCRYDGYNELLEHAFISDKMHANFV